MSIVKWAGRHRQAIRRIVSIENEYRLRRTLCRALPAQRLTSVGHILHCTVRNAGSQWVRLILSDPFFYRYHGHLPYVAGELPARGGRGAMLTSLYWSYGKCRQHLDANGKTICVIRDPRDLVVAQYFSTRYSHDPIENILEWRAKLSGLNQEDGIEIILEMFLRTATLLGSWTGAARNDPRVLIVRFEDITGDNQHEVWRRVLNHLEIAAPTSEIDRLLTAYDPSNLRPPGVTASGIARYRRRGPGEWKTELSSRNLESFMRRYGGLVPALGYDER